MNDHFVKIATCSDKEKTCCFHVTVNMKMTSPKLHCRTAINTLLLVIVTQSFIFILMKTSVEYYWYCKTEQKANNNLYIFFSVMIATVEEMDAAQVPLRHRGYCAHLYIDWRKCMQHHYWMPSKCKGLESRYDHCEHDEYV